MLTSNSPIILTTLENIIAPGGRARISPYIESAQFQLLFGERPDPKRRFESAQQILMRHAERIEELARIWGETMRKDQTPTKEPLFLIPPLLAPSQS